MDLTPDLLLEAKFSPARRGYDMNEVDDFLERCAEGLDVLLARLKAEFERAERAEETVAELRSALASVESAPAAESAARPPVAEPTPVEEEAEVPATAEVVEAAPEAATAQPEAPAQPVSVEEPMRILVAAERTAEAAIAEAKAEAERIRAEAESVASTTRSEAEALLSRSRAEAEAEARRAGEEARRSIEAEVLSLRRDRDALTHDVRSLRRWLDEQRARMRTTARDLQRLVDDPAALRDLPLPELREDSTDEAEAEDSTAETDPAPAGASDPDNLAATDEAEAGLTIFDDGDEGEPTQAVPAVDRLKVFDDDETDGSGNGRADSDVLR